MSERKPREFWIYDRPNYDGILNTFVCYFDQRGFTPKPGDIHVREVLPDDCEHSGVELKPTEEAQKTKGWAFRDTTDYRDCLEEDFKEAHERIEALEHVLEAVRSQMCWERDRDHLTMGMQDLHTAVTEVLGRKG